jgi:hypothetical protein
VGRDSIDGGLNTKRLFLHPPMDFKVTLSETGQPRSLLAGHFRTLVRNWTTPVSQSTYQVVNRNKPLPIHQALAGEFFLV